MRNTLNLKWMVWILVIFLTTPALAENDWRTRAYIDVPATGIVEAVVPPELVVRKDTGAMDLSLAGPAGNIRSFELYWREPVDDARIVLPPAQVSLDERKGFVWEADIPERIYARQLTIRLAAKTYIGKIDVQGYRQGKWTFLVKNAAIFNNEKSLYGRIGLPKAEYNRIRLHLTGFDIQAKPQLSPIKSVTVTGERIGKDFAGKSLSLPFQQSETEKAIIIDASLPGIGLWIHTLALKTEAQFQGSWQVGTETIRRGKKEFVAIKSGRVSHVDRQYQILEIGLNSHWPGRALVLKLNTGHRFIGTITGLEADVRLPRLVFAAEKKGRYTLLADSGQAVPVFKRPGDALRKPDIQLVISSSETNPLWKPASLVDRFRIQGAPFDATGYTWRSPVSIPTPGYYRLALSLKSVLRPHTLPVRIVKGERQIPYIQGRVQTKTIEISVEEAFDAKKNQSQWSIQLPGPSGKWQSMSLYSAGIFKRTVRMEYPKPGNMGWQPWRTVVWENRKLKETALWTSLHGLPPTVDRIRITIDHGDNQPVKISKIIARYTTPTFYFLAHQPGDYFVCGGNTNATRPIYDLSLVQNELLAVLPEDVTMGDLELFQKPGFKQRFLNVFADTGWGLYAILGVVTLALIGIIFLLFPKVKVTENHKK